MRFWFVFIVLAASVNACCSARSNARSCVFDIHATLPLPNCGNCPTFCDVSSALKRGGKKLSASAFSTADQ